MEAQPKLYVWFEEFNEQDYLCIEWHGGFEPNAAWYRPFWNRLRMELGCTDPTSPSGWQKGTDGLAGKVWRLRLASSALEVALTRQQAYSDVQDAVKAFNSYPHNIGIVLEAI